VYERSARTNIGEDVKQMRQALLQGQQLIERTTSAMQQFMRQSEYIPAQQVDLKPQITWVSDRFRALISYLDHAEEMAEEAMTQTRSYTTSVNDVAQDVLVQQRDLADAQEKGEALASKAEQQLRDSENLVREKESSLRDKTAEISRKSAEVASHRAKVPGYKITLAENERELAQARSKKEDRKAGAIAGYVKSALSDIAGLG
jgi:chromosome segregation ATPase